MRTRWTLQRGKPRGSGIRPEPYFWGDLLDGPPPRKTQRGQSAYVLYLGTEEGVDVQVSYTTIVRAGHGHEDRDEVVLVEERLSVQRRALQELLDRERELSERLISRWRAAAAARNARQRAGIATLRTRWLAAVLLALVQVEARLGNLLMRATQLTLRLLVIVPDKILTRMITASLHLSSRSGRRELRLAFVDPSKATSQEKSIVLLLAATALVFFVLIASNFVALAFTAFAPQYQRFVADFTASLLSVLALPIPIEPLLILSLLAFGPVLAVSGLLLGKIVGSWMLYLIGDTLFDELEKKTAKRPRLKRMTDWMQLHADRSGFWLLTLINSVPFFPDLLVYPFAVSGMRYRSYLGGILFGTAIKFAAIIAGVYLVGPAQVQAFLEHPIQTLRGP